MTEPQEVQLEAMRRKLQQMEEGQRRQREFFRALAHDVANLVLPVEMALQLLRGPHDAQTTRLVEEMLQEQVPIMKGVVESLRDISSVMRKGGVSVQPVELGQILRGVVEARRPQAEQKQLEVSLSLEDEPLTLDADPQRLGKVFDALLSNAIMYTPTGGKIALRARRESQEAIVRVRDYGVGIRPQLLPHVFELFVQGADPHSSPVGSWGVGLAMARSHVELHQGTIEAHSPGPGQGTEIVVRLPLRQD